mgnify:CR=1 FL=1
MNPKRFCGVTGVSVKEVTASVLRIEDDRVHDGPVINVIPPHIKEEGCSFVDWSRDVTAILMQHERRFLRRIRVSRIPKLIGEVVIG